MTEDEWNRVLYKNETVELFDIKENDGLENYWSIFDEVVKHFSSGQIPIELRFKQKIQLVC